MFTSAQGSGASMQNGDSPSSCPSQSEDDYDQKDSVASEVVSEIDKQEVHVQSDDKSVDPDTDVVPTDVSYLLGCFFLGCYGITMRRIEIQ